MRLGNVTYAISKKSSLIMMSENESKVIYDGSLLGTARVILLICLCAFTVIGAIAVVIKAKK